MATSSISQNRPWPFKTTVAVPVTIKQYVSREQISLACPIKNTPSFRALERCYAWEVDAGLDLTSLFWSTQTRARQKYFCAPCLRIAPEEHRSLCVKCGRWIIAKQLPLHLPIHEIKLFMIRHPARAEEILDATNQCLTAKKLPTP